MFKQKVQQSVNDCIETNHIIKLWILLRATQEIEKMISCNEINQDIKIRRDKVYTLIYLPFMKRINLTYFGTTSVEDN